MRDKIILVGFMGTGKTTVGKLIASKLSWRFADTDAVIEAKAGKPVREIFAQDGEPAFRALEAELCREIGTWRRCVVATGGGILLDPANRAVLLESGFVICLQASVQQIAARLEHDKNRPLLAGADRMQRLTELLTEREALYATLPTRLNTTGMTPFSVSERVIHLWRIHR